MTDKTPKGNTHIPVVYVTHKNTSRDTPFIYDASLEPWGEDYDAPITKFADHTKFVNAADYDAVVAARDMMGRLWEKEKARAEYAETALATAPDALADGRPCSTDVWMAAALEQLDDKWDFFEACKDWVHGDWDGAMEGVTIRALATEGKDNE